MENKNLFVSFFFESKNVAGLTGHGWIIMSDAKAETPNDLDDISEGIRRNNSYLRVIITNFRRME